MILAPIASATGANSETDAGSFLRVGKSMISRSPSRATVSAPDSVWNTTLSRPGSRWLSTTNALARVACPHSGISTVGVNQRRWKSGPCGTKYAVSARLCSAAIDASIWSGSHSWSGITAAGLPANGLLLNASTWKNFIAIPPPLSRRDRNARPDQDRARQAIEQTRRRTRGEQAPAAFGQNDIAAIDQIGNDHDDSGQHQEIGELDLRHVEKGRQQRAVEQDRLGIAERDQEAEADVLDEPLPAPWRDHQRRNRGTEHFVSQPQEIRGAGVLHDLEQRSQRGRDRRQSDHRDAHEKEIGEHEPARHRQSGERPRCQGARDDGRETRSGRQRKKKHADDERDGGFQRHASCARSASSTTPRGRRLRHGQRGRRRRPAHRAYHGSAPSWPWHLHAKR